MQHGKGISAGPQNNAQAVASSKAVESQAVSKAAAVTMPQSSQPRGWAPEDFGMRLPPSLAELRMKYNPLAASPAAELDAQRQEPQPLKSVQVVSVQTLPTAEGIPLSSEPVETQNGVTPAEKVCPLPLSFQL